MIGKYNRLAFFYDALGTIAFGGALSRANSLFIKHIPPNSNILILGGGTGKILENLPPDSRVDYVDFSSAMITKAKARKTRANVAFYESDFFDFDIQKRYDLIVCPFFLDQFSAEELRLFASLHDYS